MARLYGYCRISTMKQKLQRQIENIKAKYPELSILVIEHRMDLVMNLSDYIYVQDFGQTIAQGVPEEIQNNPLVLKAYLGEED